MAARKEEINLLPQKGFESTTTGRVLAWILSTFRTIVIVTEIIVMVAFLSRFWLDAQNTDLNEKILQKQAVLTASQDFESKFKDVQKRLKIFSELTKTERNTPALLNAITTSLAPDVVLVGISVERNSLEIAGITPSEKSILQTTVNLEDTPEFKDVGILEIKIFGDSQNLIFFKLGASLETEGGK